MRRRLSEYRYYNAEFCALVDQCIHNERNRAILKRKLVDGKSYEDLAAEFGLSAQQIKNIVYRDGDKVLNLLTVTKITNG